MLAALVFCGVLTGCRPPSPEVPDAAKKDAPTIPAVSSVPLRVWIAAPLSDPQLFTRQWMSDSEQPLAIRSLTPEELLQQSACECDVLIYPARLVGELVHRDWIMGLPENVTSYRELADNASVDGDSGTPNGSQRACETRQAAYAGRNWAIALGCAIPTFVASPPLAQQLSADVVSWNTLLESLPRSEGALKLDIDDTQVDKDALVDRFLAIVATVATRDPTYGLLFDMQTMQSRLKEPEFVIAIDILGALAAQPNGAEAILGSHSTAWKWSAENEQAALAISSVALIGNEAINAKSGKILRVSGTPEPSGAAAGAGNDARPALAGWNPGGGLNASLASNCRQSSQATWFLGWLRANSTRTALAPLIPGIESQAPRGGVDALSWQARQTIAELTSSGGGISQELRLPAAHRYRQALSDALSKFLQGELDAQAALSEAHAGWQQITSEMGPSLRDNYEKSLGLTL